MPERALLETFPGNASFITGSCGKLLFTVIFLPENNFRSDINVHTNASFLGHMQWESLHCNPGSTSNCLQTPTKMLNLSKPGLLYLDVPTHSALQGCCIKESQVWEDSLQTTSTWKIEYFISEKDLRKMVLQVPLVSFFQHKPKTPDTICKPQERS